MSSRSRRRGGWAGLEAVESVITLSNDGNGRLKAPGFGLPIHFELAAEGRFSHGASDWAQPRMTVREIAMLQLMNDITDRLHWDTVILEDAEITATSRDEALQRNLISPGTWDWCFAELQDSARTFRETRCVDALNSSSVICKADGIISADALANLQAGIEALIQDSPPGTRDLVDPTLYPLAYGESKVLITGGQVPLSNISSCIGQGEEAPHFPRRPTPQPSDGWGGKRWLSRVHAAAYRSSTNFQMLPCEVAFKNESAGHEVNVTSYINNLHPRHSSLYTSIESVLGAAVPLWDRVLIKREANRLPPRIRTYGGQIEPSKPSWFRNLPKRWVPPDVSTDDYHEVRRQVYQYLDKPEPPPDLRVGSPRESTGFTANLDGDWEQRIGLWNAAHIKHQRLRHTLHPEPGVLFSYNDWKAGKAGRPVVTGQFVKGAVHRGDMPNPPPYQRGARVADDGFTILEYPDHEFPTVNLAESFQAQGLQVVVKLSHTALSPESPRPEAEDWHIDGMLNDHIVAAAVLVVESSNVAPAQMDFRVEADLDPLECGYLKEDEMKALEIVFGLQRQPRNLQECEPAIQNLGTIRIPTGRLVAYPNVLQHRMQPLELIDPSLPGHQYMLTCFLVDPHYRVCSTRNVPPQRHDWWIDAVSEICKWPYLPAEIFLEITRHVDDFPIGEKRARQWKAKMEDQLKISQEAMDFGTDQYKLREQDSYDSDGLEPVDLTYV